MSIAAPPTANSDPDERQDQPDLAERRPARRARRCRGAPGSTPRGWKSAPRDDHQREREQAAEAVAEDRVEPVRGRGPSAVQPSSTAARRVEVDLVRHQRRRRRGRRRSRGRAAMLLVAHVRHEAVRDVAPVRVQLESPRRRRRAGRGRRSRRSARSSRRAAPRRRRRAPITASDDQQAGTAASKSSWRTSAMPPISAASVSRLTSSAATSVDEPGAEARAARARRRTPAAG